MMHPLLRSLRRALPWLLLAALAASATALAMLPAAWIVPQFARASAGRVNLSDPQGSLWRGSATLMLSAGADARAATILPGRIEWTTAFWPLVTGHVQMRMRQSEAMPEPITLDASTAGATLSAGRLGAPASLLVGLGAPFNTLDLQGNFRIEWTNLRLLGGNAYGQIALRLADAASRVSRVKPLGSYQAVIVATGADATLKLTTLKGPLQLSGDGQLSHGSVSFHGVASAEPAAQENLAGLLNLLGPRIAPGQYALIFQ